MSRCSTIAILVLFSAGVTLGCGSDDGGGAAEAVDTDVGGGDPFDTGGDAALPDSSAPDAGPADASDTTASADGDPSDAASSDGSGLDAGDTAADADHDVDLDADLDVKEPLPANWTSCLQDNECAIAFAGCCDLCNGGEPVAARLESVDFVADFIDPNGDLCAGVQCATLPCPAAKPFCDKGTCGVRFESNVEGGCSELDEAQCDASPVCKTSVGTPLAQFCDPELELEPVPTGCVLSESCFEVETCAQHPSGFISMVYGDSCYPAGWTPCGPNFCAQLVPSCLLGQAPPIAQYCVRGVPVEGGELIDGTVPVTVEFRPKGCFSQTCTYVSASECAASLFDENRIVVQGEYCFGLTPGVICAGDCLGAKAAECAAFDLSPGLFHIEALGRKKSFTIPSVVPVGGFCLEIQAK